MLDLNKWCGVKYKDKIINFQWVEIASCPNPELNGEYTFTQILKKSCKFDTVIDVGASNSIYPEIFPNQNVLLFDVHNIDINSKNVTAIKKYIGFEEDQVKLDDYLIDNNRYFIKIDVNGFEKNVIKTISNSKKESIVCLQFEYDCMWRDTNSKLQEVVELLPFDKFYSIEHNGLREIVSFEDDYMYRNIICGNLNFDYIDSQMKKESLLSAEQTIWDGNNPIIDEYVNKVIWWSKNEIRKYTEQRRRLTNFPLSTFVINSTIIKKPHILLRIVNRIKSIFS